jgi:hypothetical protein
MAAGLLAHNVTGPSGRMKGIGPMDPNANTPPYLGAAFLGVIPTSLVSISTEGEVCQ